MCRVQQARSTSTTYIDYIIDFLRFFRGNVHIMGVCQPTVPVFAAVSLMEGMNDPAVPRSMILMAGPIDARESPTAVNEFAKGRSLNWFRHNVITQVPWPYPGMMRLVYPGFLQLSGFMGMNFDRHVTAHRELFHNLIRGDGDSADKHREFYDEFLAVMDLTAEYYLQTIETVFLEHKLPTGTMVHRNRLVDPAKIHQGRADDRRRGKGRHLRTGTNLCCTNFVQIPRSIHARALHAARRRPLRRLQRVALPRRNSPANPRFYQDTSTP